MRDEIRRTAAAASEAAGRIDELIRRTPLERSSYFSDRAGAEVYFKLENLQHTGSFKLRGAANCLLSLPQERRDRGCVAASSGNHGAAVAYAMRALGVGGVIFVPEQTSPAKVEAIRSFGGQVQFFGTDGLDTEQHARAYAEQEGLYYISPYNDAAVVAGQGTCGVEIVEQLPDIDAISHGLAVHEPPVRSRTVDTSDEHRHVRGRQGALDLQRARLHHRPRKPRRALHTRGPGDRGGVDEGIHDAARGACAGA